MFLKYLGVNKNFTLDMPYFISGPYFIEGRNYVVEIDDADAPSLLEKNPAMFRVVDAPPADTDGEFKCDQCDKVCKTEAGLASHIAQIHPPQGEGDTDAETG